MLIEFRYDRDEAGAPLDTTAIVQFADGRNLLGKAWCHESDNPCKEVGRKLALQRAIEDLPREEREKVWQHYFSRKG